MRVVDHVETSAKPAARPRREREGGGQVARRQVRAGRRCDLEGTPPHSHRVNLFCLRPCGRFWLQHSVANLRNVQRIIQTPNPDNPGYARQQKQGKLWVRDRLTLFLDPGSFQEVGSVTGKAIYDETTGELKEFVPA